MKRIMSLLILLFMVVSLVLPISTINNTKQKENDVVEPILLSDITYEIEVVEVVNLTPTPTPDPYEVAMQNMQTEMAEIESITDKKEWFLAYKDIVFKYAEWTDPPETVFDYFTEDEVRLICQMVETETYDQPFEAKCNTASVAFNRIERGGEFGNSVKEVITKPNQFVYGRENLTEDTILAVQYAFEIQDTTDGCVGFRSDDNPPEEWNGWKRMFQDISGHWFYK